MTQKRVNLLHASPIHLITWVETEFDRGLSYYTRRRLERLGVNRSADLESFLASVNPSELIAVMHPTDIVNFILDRILYQIERRKKTEQLRYLRITRIADRSGADLILVPTETFNERVEVGDIIKSELMRVWNRELIEYSWSPHLQIIEMENICLELKHLIESDHFSSINPRYIDSLFLRLSKAYEQHICSLMYFARAVMVDILGDNEPAIPPKRNDSQDDGKQTNEEHGAFENQVSQNSEKFKKHNWTLYDMEMYLFKSLDEWSHQNDIGARYKHKLFNPIKELLRDEIAIPRSPDERKLRQHRNINVHSYLTPKQRREYLERMLAFVNRMKELRIATGYITSVSRSATATRVEIRLDGGLQSASLMYRDLASHTYLKNIYELDRAIYRDRVMMFPLKPDDRGIFQPLLVKYGVFERKRGIIKHRCTLFYTRLDVEYSFFDDISTALSTQQVPVLVED